MNEIDTKIALNFNLISKWMTSDGLINEKILKPGDLVEMYRPQILGFGYSHWVLIVKYTNNDYEIILVNQPINVEQKGWLREAADSSKIRLNNGMDEREKEISLTLDPIEKIIGRAEERINNRSWGNLYDKYNIFINNCEHFVTFCRYGVPYMGQSKLAFDAINILKPPLTEIEIWLRNLNVNYSNSSEQLATDMVKQNTIPWLIKLLKSSRNDICDYVLDVLEKIAHYRIYNDQLIFHGLMEHFKTYSETYLSYENIGKLLIWLRIMEEISETHGKEVIDAGIMKWIIILIEKSFFFDFVILQHSASILCNISNGTKDQVTAIVNSFTNENGSRLVALMEFCNDNISISLLEAFTNIVKHEGFSNSVIQYGILTQIARFLKSSNTDLHVVAIAFIHYLTYYDENGKIAVTENELIPSIIKFLNSKYIHIRETAGIILNNMAITSVERREMICKAVCSDHDVPKLICKIKNGKFTNYDMFKLANIAYYQVYNSEIIESGIINHMKEFLKDSSDAYTKHQAIRLISYITSNSVAQNEVVKNETILKLIIRLFDSENLEILLCLTRTFENMANANKENAKIIVEWNIVPKLIKLFKFKDGKVGDGAVSALKSILSHETLLKEKPNTLQELKKFLNDSENYYVLDFLATLAASEMHNEIFDDTEVLNYVSRCLQSLDINVRVKTLRLLVNISVKSLDKFQSVINANLIFSLIGSNDTLITKMALSLLSYFAVGNEEHTQAIVDAGVIQKLINLLESPKEIICEKAAIALGNIAFHKRFYCTLLESNVFIHLTNISKHSNFEIQRQARRIVDNVKSNTDVNGIIESNHVPAIITLLDSKEAIILEFAISTLDKVMKESIENATIVISGDLIPKIKNLLCSPDLHEHTAMLNILVTIARYQIFNDGLIKSDFIKTMENFIKEGSDTSNQYLACSFIFNVANDTTYIKDIIACDNIIQYIIALLESKISKIVYSAALVLAQIVSGTKDEIQVIINSGAIPKLKYILSNNSDNSDNAMIVANCFTSICEHKEFIAEILDSNVLESLKMRLLNQNQLVKNIRFIIRLLFKFSCGSIEQKQLILDSNICSILIDFINVNNEKICAMTLHTMSNLFNGTQAQAESLINATIISKLIQLLESDKENICEATLFTLANIAQHQIFNDLLIQAGILAFIERFLSHENEDIVMEIVRLIWHIPVAFEKHYANYSKIFSTLNKLLDDEIAENLVEYLMSIDRMLINFNDDDAIRQKIIQKLAENGVPDKIKILSSNENNQIQNLTSAILEKCDFGHDCN